MRSLHFTHFPQTYMTQVTAQVSKKLLKASSRSLNPRLHFSLLLPQVLEVYDSKSSYCPLHLLILPSLSSSLASGCVPRTCLIGGQAAAHPVYFQITREAL